MRKIAFDPTKLDGQLKQGWDSWMAKAEAATKRAINAWEEWRNSGSQGKFDCQWEKEVWGELKEWLLENIFHHKCAYCETREIRSNYHAEHFRPKGSVRLRPTGQEKLQRAHARDEQGNEMEHPGYFWLAYHWSNLLPSCQKCNTALKNDQFPVANHHVGADRLTAAAVRKLIEQKIKSMRLSGVYYLQPSDLNRLEKPLLLNPYFDDPSKHIRFGDRGIVTACEGSAQGDESIRIYNLDDEDLRVARQAAQRDGLKTYVEELTRGQDVPLEQARQAAKAAITDYIQGKKPYSVAVLDYLRLTSVATGLD